MTTANTIVIVGGGLAGAKAAEAARECGYSGRVLLIGEENRAPYERPPLSKGVLRGEADPSSADVHDGNFYAAHDIELVTDRVAGLEHRRLQLAGGSAVPFDAAVLATGAAPRRLTIPGAGLGGVHYLRTLEDALQLREDITAATRVVVVGAGWIGSEVAASARQMGAEVVLVDPAPVPLQRVLGEAIGAVFARLHADHGVHLRLGVGVAELRGTGNVEEVVLSDGRVEPADVVLVGVGVQPRIELAAGATGVGIDNGIVVDHHLRTEVPGIFAAGDVANAWHPHYQRHLRVEHWANALNQGLVAGRNAAGQSEAYTQCHVA